jgi:hypothetical protein
MREMKIYYNPQVYEAYTVGTRHYIGVDFVKIQQRSTTIDKDGYFTIWYVPILRYSGNPGNFIER